MLPRPVSDGNPKVVGTVRNMSPAPLRRAPSVVVIAIRDIDVDGGPSLRREEPLELVATRHEPGGSYHAEFPDLDVPIAGYGREDLLSEVSALVASAWNRFMGVDEESLAPLAISLRNRLRALCAEVG